METSGVRDPVSGNVIPFRTRRQLDALISETHANMIEQASRDIARIVGEKPCPHLDMKVASQNGRVVWFCNECMRVVHK